MNTPRLNRYMSAREIARIVGWRVSEVEDRIAGGDAYVAILERIYYADGQGPRIHVDCVPGVLQVDAKRWEDAQRMWLVAQLTGSHPHLAPARLPQLVKAAVAENKAVLPVEAARTPWWEGGWGPGKPFA